jgi:hypothetical protein
MRVSRAGCQGTSWKPRPLSMMAKRPLTRLTTPVETAADVVAGSRRKVRRSMFSRDLLPEALDFESLKSRYCADTYMDVAVFGGRKAHLDEFLRTPTHFLVDLSPKPAVSDF